MKLILTITALHDLKVMQAKYLQCTQKLLYLSVNYKIAWALKRNRYPESETAGRQYKNISIYPYIKGPFFRPSNPCKDSWQCSLLLCALN